MTNALRALVTDLDGVLCDTETVFVQAVNALLEEEGLIALSDEEARSLVGLDNDSWWRALRARDLQISLADYTARADVLARARMKRDLKLAPGVTRLLSQAREAGLRVALASSADRPYVEFRLRLLGLMDAFDAIITRADVTHPKPHPEVYLAATQALGVDPAEAVALEDSPTGLRAAREAGLFTVAVRTPWTEGLDLPDAHRIVESLDELDLRQLRAAPTGRQ